MIDIAIIGGGVVGCLIARELSRFKVSVCIIERGTDVALGTSKANSAIVHPGFFEPPGSTKARLNVQGNQLMEQLSKDLDFPFKRIGSLMLALSDEQKSKLNIYLEKGIKNGVPGMEILDREQVLNMEPNVSSEVKSALYAPTAGIVSPYEVAIAAAENAVLNGVNIILETEVTDIEKVDGCFVISTNKNSIKARFMINAAGVYSDYINNMVSKNQFFINPVKGEYFLLDKSCNGLISRVLFQTPSGVFKGILATPTVDGNILLGPTEANTKNKEDLEVTQKGVRSIMSETKRLIPNLPYGKNITMFAGLRAVSPVCDFIIGEVEDSKGFINVAAIESPGLTSSPAIAKMVVDIVDDKCIKLELKENYTMVRQGISRFREMNDEKRQELIKKDSAYGRVVCRCEMVTEGEIADAVSRTFGVKSLDAVKRRARAGMGRCQGGFCGSRIMEIISREEGIPFDQITKHGGESWLLKSKTK